MCVHTNLHFVYGEMGDFALKQDNFTHIEMVGQSVKHTHLARHCVNVRSETGIGLILSHMNQ